MYVAYTVCTYSFIYTYSEASQTRRRGKLGWSRSRSPSSSIHPSTSGPPPPSPSSWRLLSLIERNLQSLFKNVNIEYTNYRIIDFPYRSRGFFTYRINDLSIIEPAYLRKLSIHRYRSTKLTYRTNDYRFKEKISSAHLCPFGIVIEDLRYFATGQLILETQKIYIV